MGSCRCFSGGGTVGGYICEVGRCIGSGRILTGWFVVWRGWYSGMMENTGGGRAFTGGWCGGGALGNGAAATALVKMLES